MLGAITTALLCLARISLAADGSGFLPDGFSNVDFSQYTVRYVSSEGEDTEACLQSQPYAEASSQEDCLPQGSLPAARPCRSIGYALLGHCNLIPIEYRDTDCVPEVRTNLMILVHPGIYDYGESFSVIAINYTNLIIRRLHICSSDNVVTFVCTKFTEVFYNNLYIVSSTNLLIDGITFARCGPKSPGAAMLDVDNATITNCEFRDNLNTGFVAYSPYDTTFRNCTFRDNNSTFAYDQTESLSPGDYRYAGGLTLAWRNRLTRPVAVLIKDCVFINNTASINANNTNDTNRPNFYVPRGHGGALIASFNNTQNHTVLIEDTVMTDNAARYNGGGVFVSFYNQSNWNQLIINRTRIERNSCNNVGGAISMNTFEIANFNYLIVEGTNFTDNRAWAGGGACTINHQDNRIPAADNLEQPIDNVGVFKNCIFQNNSSPTGGSAVSMVSNARVDQVSAPTNFTDCQFLSNKGSLDSAGAIMGFRFPVSLKGTNVFRENKGGCVSLLQSQLHAFGHTLFQGNTAENGGAINIKDFSLIQLFEGTNMTFVNNSAIRWRNDTTESAAVGVGGAIAIFSSSVGIDADIIRLFNTRCFLQYEVGNASVALPPSNWSVNISFINNTADVDGAAVYATDVERCTYTPTLNVSANTSSYYRSIFKTRVFTFEGNRVRRSGRNVADVATAPSRLIVEPELTERAPGEVVTFTISAVDESENWKRAIWNINENDQIDQAEDFFLLPEGSSPYEYRVCANTKASCSPNTERTLRFSILQIIARSVSNMTEVKVRVRDCYPGYYLNGNECSIKNSSQILRPDSINRYIYIKSQYYAAYTNESDEDIVYAIAPIPFQYCQRGNNSLPGCLFQYDQMDKQCSEGREEFLCGRCIPGVNGTRRGVDLTLFQCSDCTIRDTVLVVIIVILFWVTCALILIYNIGIPNELRGCLFFIQVVGFVYRYRAGDNNAPWDFHLSRVFGSSLYLPLCPYPGTNALFTTSYGLLLPTLAIITIIVYVISARFIKHLSNKNSFEGIWLLTFIIYKFIADTCFNILRCQRVTSDNKELQGDLVYYYDGTFKCFTVDDIEHLCFAIIALVLGVLVILFPALILLISFKRYKLTEALTDVLNKDLKISCRWWSSFDLFRRLLFIIVVLIFNYVSPLYGQLALLFSGVFVFFTFACTQPYNSRTANIMEALVQLDLLILTAIFLHTPRHHQDAVRPFAAILLLIPFVSLILYIAVRLGNYAWSKWCPMSIHMLCSRGKVKISKHLGLRHLVQHEVENTFDEELSLSSIANLEGTIQSEYSEFREELLDSS